MGKPRKAERPHENFEILDLRQSDDLAGLVNLVLSPYQAGPAAFAILDYVLRRECTAVVVERQYVDRDHSRSYTRFYAGSFRDLEKRATRLHFFARPIRRASLTSLSRPSVLASYMGYCVLRPLGVRPIGRTVLKPLPSDPDSEFPITTGQFSVNIGGSSLKVQGAAFMEQDARVATCASAACWMSTTTMAARFGFPTYTTAEITDFATAYAIGERVMPSGGLTSDQIAEAVRRMGYDPATFAVTSAAQGMELIYPYVESGIAPILLLELVDGYHAITAVGHTFDVKRQPAEPTEVLWEQGTIRVWRSWQWADALLVHDDQRGPYRRLELLDVDSERLRTEIQAIYGDRPGFDVDSLDLKDWDCPVRIDTSLPLWEGAGTGGSSDIANLYGVVIPMPRGISLNGPEAHDKVARILRIWYEGLEREVPEDLYLRTYLAESNVFKERTARNQDLHRYARRMYLGKGMPRWLWVTEVGVRGEVLAPRVSDQRIRGEVLLDVNSSPWLPDFVALHMPMGDGQAHLTTMRPDESDIGDIESALVRGGWLLFGERSYPPLQR